MWVIPVSLPSIGIVDPLSIFDIFKVGVGPSSSHTLGPWRAAQHFAERLEGRNVERIRVYLYGSLSKTGKGHATDKAVILGLQGYDPLTIDTASIDSILQEVESSRRIVVNGVDIPYSVEEDLVFENYEHIKHPNTIKFVALTARGVVKEEDYTSVGGGFIEVGTPEEKGDLVKLPFPINEAADLVRHTNDGELPISDIVAQNELCFRSEEEVEEQLDLLIDVMLDSVYEGCNTTGVLPGGLQVRRRANSIIRQLTGKDSFSSRNELLDTIRNSPKDFVSVNKFVSCFAIAVNEQNASMNRVVTSPTNGAAGVIPAALMYYMLFCDFKGREDIRRFLYTAGEIGCLFKKKATISAAVGGCQAEIGVSSSMAAAALAELKGGNAHQCMMAAEIAMEHHLGLTCDPIGGLVQIPCIERNAMGAIKAITAANLALVSEAKDAIVKLDTVIATMWQTAQDMSSKYKETSEGGLALHMPVIVPSC